MTAPNPFAGTAPTATAPTTQAPAVTAPAATAPETSAPAAVAPTATASATSAPAAVAPTATASATTADKLFGDVNTGGGDFTPFSHMIGRAVLIRPLETGTMKTEHNDAQDYALVDLLPLTQPHDDYVHPQSGAVTPIADQAPAGEWIADRRIMQKEPFRDCATALRRGTPFIKGWVVKGKASKGRNAPYLLTAIEDDAVNEYAKAKAIEATTGL